MSQIYFDDGPAAIGFKVMLATTAYESPDASYTFSIQRSRQRLDREGIPSAYLLLCGNCHVDDARNVVVQQFLLSDCTDLVFIDADVSWEPESLIELCLHDCDIVGGVYPFRKEGRSINMPVRMIEGVTEPDKRGLLEVEGLPTGFMRIKREVLETLSNDADHYRNRGERRSDVPILFERAYVPGTRIGGDINFCMKWRAKGGKVFAAYEMRLGHTAKTVIRDSLGAALRRQSDITLGYIADKIREGSTDIQLLREARNYCHNPYGALEDVLSLAVIMARKADGPILETGSGLSTVLMAAANPDQTIWCIEHDKAWAAQVESMAYKAGVFNIAIVHSKIENGWYAIEDDLPGRFALALHDGPPRRLGSRMHFFDDLAKQCNTIIVDDADDRGYAEALEKWCKGNGQTIDFVDERAALIRSPQDADIQPKALQGHKGQADEALGRRGRAGLVQDQGRSARGSKPARGGAVHFGAG